MKPFKKILRIAFWLVTPLLVLGILGLVVSRLITHLFSWQRTYSAEEAPIRRAAIVFGAGLRRDGTPTPVLRDRVETAAKLFFQGKVEKLLMSGDNRYDDYNEPEAMRRYALNLGVPDEEIVLDYAGRSTYETCYRARDIFEVNDVILVTQGFHLPRALYTCNSLGVRAIGVSADQRVYRPLSRLIWNIREIPATLKAIWQVHVSHPLPILGKPEPIFPGEAH